MNTTRSAGDTEDAINIAELGEPTEERQSNAGLISAAPELLEAIKTIKSVLTDWNKDGKYSNLIFHAETAIKKATFKDF
jgi:hypothetical protein